MKKVVHLKTAKVTGHEPDGSAIVERHVIKLEVGRSFNNFLKHINLKGYRVKEAPEIIKALELSEDGKTWKAIKADEYKEQLAEALAPAKTKAGDKIDYKELSEKQAQEIQDLRSVNVSFEERLNALEGNSGIDDLTGADELTDDDLTDDEIKEKARSLEITFPANIGRDTLLAKIKEVEPDFGK